MNRKVENIEHSTFNTEHRMIQMLAFDWTLGVECWMLNVSLFHNGGLP